MKIILSPTKTMGGAPERKYRSLPGQLEKTERLLSLLRGLSAGELQQLYGCSPAIAGENYRRLQEMELREGLSPAIFSFEGLVFRHLDAGSLNEQELRYLEEHLRILSGFYGCLRPMDGIRSYRLDLEDRLALPGGESLYGFWGESIYSELQSGGRVINLASGEYARAIRPYLKPGERMTDCLFCEYTGGKLRQKATFSKMARGEMLRFLARRGAEEPEEMKDFSALGYSFRQELSSENEYVFVKKGE